MQNRRPFFIFAVTVLAMLPALDGCLNAQVDGEGIPNNPLVGKWEYAGCTIKNTGMIGTLRFYTDGHMVLDARARDDYPVPEVSGSYTYKIEKNRLVSDYNSYGVCEFFLVEGDMLYFSWQEISKSQEEWKGGRLVANWQYRLKRVR